MKKKLHLFTGLLFVLVLNSFAIAQTNYYVSMNGNNANDGLSAASSKATINGALSAAAAGDIIHVAPGTYTEKVNINKQGITLISTEGASVTFILPSNTAGVGTIAVENGIHNITIGESGKGFTITGFDGDGVSETGAVYLTGAHQNIRIEGNHIVANGEHGLVASYNSAIDNIIINNNTFSGKTFTGNEPGGCGSSTQFILGNNVPRQLVVLGGGENTTNSKNVTFTNNKIVGSTGGYNSALGCVQGNTQVTIDVIGATISGNIFNGITTSGSNLRTRGNATSIFCNTFYNANLGTNATHLFLFDQDPLTGAYPNSITGILASNSFPEGGSAFTGNYITGNKGTYFIFRDAAQATAVNQLAGNVFSIAHGQQSLVMLEDVFGYGVASEPGACGAVVNLSNPQVFSACNTALASVTNDAPSGNFFPVGTTRVIWTATDIHGNTDTAWQFVSVIDNELPVIKPVTAISLCEKFTGQYEMPSLTITDNCGIGSITYTITGATNRSGKGADASGSFNTGKSTISFIATDVNGNMQTYSFEVTITAATIASYSVSKPDAFCNQLSVTANGSSGASYNWSCNGITVGKEQVLKLGLTNQDGIYQLQITDAAGCISTTAVYTYEKQQFAGNYTLLATHKLTLGSGNIVATGSAGVSGSTGLAVFEKNSSVASPGAFVKAPYITQNGSGINLASLIYERALVQLPAMQYNTVATRSLSNYTVNRNITLTLNGNYNSLMIRKGADVVLNGDTFGQIYMEEGARVRFTATVLNIAELNINKGSSTAFTTVRFAAGTSVRVSGKVQVEGNSRINPDQHNITMYLGDFNSDEEQFIIKGTDIQINTNIYIPNGNIRLINEMKNTTTAPVSNVRMTGFFIANEIESIIPNVVWNSYACGAQPAYVPNASVSAGFVLTENKENQEPFTVQVMGNPVANFFTLKLQSQQSLPIQLRVTDVTGKVIDNRANNQPNSTIQIGHGYAPGIYYGEFIQGANRKVVQLMKIR